MSLTKIQKDLFISKKSTILNSPGQLISDVYYSVNSATVNNTEVTYMFGRLKIGLNNPRFGSIAQVVIPNSSLQSDLILRLQLPPLTSQQAITRGFGYAAIRSI